jgi:hypothetical protein
MPPVKASSIANVLAEKFTDVWKLLSQTTLFLSRTKHLLQYEAQLREWRGMLQSSPNNTDVMRRVKAELVALRRSLREQGYDLSLGAQNLRFDGFRNDASLGEGFRRLVLFIGDGGVYWLSGEDNHIALSSFLDDRMDKLKINTIRERHYLWYRRDGNDLVFSGSDTEDKEDFRRLERIGNANPLLLLSALKGLR